jgi:hypothetical protein
MLLFSSLINIYSLTMLLSVIPRSIINLPSWPLKATLPLFHVLVILTCISFAVRPFEFSIPMKLIVLPFSYVYSLIGSNESGMTKLTVVLPLAFVKRAIFPIFLSLAGFYATNPVALILEAFHRILFFTIAVLLTFLPFACVLSSIFPNLCTSSMLKGLIIEFYCLSIILNITW